MVYGSKWYMIHIYVVEVRLTAQAANQLQLDNITGTTVLWASGKYHMRTKDIVKTNYRNHQVVAMALNHHLFQHFNPLSDY